MRTMSNAYKSFLGEIEETRSIEIPVCTWEENIKMHLEYCGRIYNGTGCLATGC
jgi:hypothetical protein